MARRQSTSKKRARRNQIAEAPAGVSLRGNGVVRFKSLEQVIEVERGRLAQAESVLGCLRSALLYANESNRGDPDFAGAAGIALKLVQEAAELIDSAYLKPLVNGLGGLSESQIGKHEPQHK